MKRSPIRRKAKPRATAAERAHLDRIAALGCVVTGAPAVIHHCMHAPGKSCRRDHRFAVPLAPELHNMGNLSVHMLGSEAKFLEVHGVDLVAEAERLWKETNDLQNL